MRTGILAIEKIDRWKAIVAQYGIRLEP